MNPNDPPSISNIVANSIATPSIVDNSINSINSISTSFDDNDTRSITLSYYVFGLLIFGSCIVGSILSFICCKFYSKKNEYD
jgi:uncharacterized membrane protein